MERLTSLFLVLKEMEEEDISWRRNISKILFKSAQMHRTFVRRTDFTITKLKTSLIDTFGLGPFSHFSCQPQAKLFRANRSKVHFSIIVENFFLIENSEELLDHGNCSS